MRKHMGMVGRSNVRYCQKKSFPDMRDMAKSLRPWTMRWTSSQYCFKLPTSGCLIPLLADVRCSIRWPVMEERVCGSATRLDMSSASRPSWRLGGVGRVGRGFKHWRLLGSLRQSPGSPGNLGVDESVVRCSKQKIISISLGNQT
jgi:hypothetical protein